MRVNHKIKCYLPSSEPTAGRHVLAVRTGQRIRTPPEIWPLNTAVATSSLANLVVRYPMVRFHNPDDRTYSPSTLCANLHRTMSGVSRDFYAQLAASKNYTQRLLPCEWDAMGPRVDALYHSRGMLGWEAIEGIDAGYIFLFFRYLIMRMVIMHLLFIYLSHEFTL